jgi:hypothetical protein
MSDAMSNFCISLGIGFRFNLGCTHVAHDFRRTGIGALNGR